MDHFSLFIERHLSPLMAKVGSNRILTIIRDSMTSLMVVLIIGSIAVLLANIPYEPVANFLLPITPFCNAISAVTTGMMGILSAGCIAYFASISYKTDILPNIIVATSVFLITQYDIEAGLNFDGLGSQGLVTAIIIGFVTVKCSQFFKEREIGLKMPDGVPPAVSASFQALIPATLSFIIFGTLTFIFGFNLNEIIAYLLSPIANIINTPLGYTLYHMLCGFAFFCGINSAVVIGIVLPFLMQNSAANELAITAGEQIPFVATYSTDSVIWAGGTGATIGLILLMSFVAKSQYFKTLGRLSGGPGIFNINEPIIFGTPICFNPVFFIPFVIFPGIIAFSTYTLMTTGIIGMPMIGMAPWTLPPVIISFVMTGGNIPATIWNIIIVILSVIVYYPFFHIADKQQYKKELQEINSTLEGAALNEI